MTAEKGSAPLAIVLDTSAFLDLFGVWTDDHRHRTKELVREVSLLALFRGLLFSSSQIRAEVGRLMSIGPALDEYVRFVSVPREEIALLPKFVPNREADYSLVRLVQLLEREHRRVFLITKDRTFVVDLARAGCQGRVIPPTGFAELITVLSEKSETNAPFAHRVQNNAFVNLSRPMRIVKETEGELAYLDWQAFLNGRTADKHKFIQAFSEDAAGPDGE